MIEGEQSGLTWDDLAWIRGERIAPDAVTARQWSADVQAKIVRLLQREERARLDEQKAKKAAT